MVAKRIDKRLARLIKDGLAVCTRPMFQVVAIEAEVDRALRSGKANYSRAAASRLKLLARRTGWEGLELAVDGDERAWEALALSRDLAWPDARLCQDVAENVAPLFVHLWLSDFHDRARHLAHKLIEGLTSPPAFNMPAWGTGHFPAFAVRCWARLENEPVPAVPRLDELGVYGPLLDLRANEERLPELLTAMCDYHLRAAASEQIADFDHPPYNLLLVDLMLVRRLAANQAVTLPTIEHPLLAAGLGVEVNWTEIRPAPHPLVARIAEKARREGNLGPDEEL